jgi:hypothetical protein
VKVPEVLSTALDPVELARRLGFQLDEWQAEVLRSEDDRILLNCSRQTGKSLTAALSAIHVALFEPGSLTLVVAPAQRQTQELFRTCLRFYRLLGRPVPAEAENQLSLTLENDSRVIALPGDEKTIRGYAGVRLLVIDEAARVSDETYFSVVPMLAVSGGKLLLMSTPYGRQGFFYETWESGDGWRRFRVPATECPRISPEFLEEQRLSNPEWLFRQEYETQFSETEEQLFRDDFVTGAISSSVKPLFEEWATLQSA